MKFEFDHCYTTDPSFKFRSKLGKAGFHLDQSQVEHPNKMFCKFIYFRSRIHKENYYLEFVNNRGPKKLHTGFSLSSKNKLKNSLTSLKSLNPKYDHKNYDWKENSKDVLPGWNFVTFPKRKSQLHIWLTEYEKFNFKSKKSKSKTNTTNPNGVQSLEGFYYDLSKNDFKLFTKLLGDSKKNYFKLQNGIKLFYDLAKTTKMKSVVVSTKKYNLFKKKYKYDFIAKVGKIEGLMILNPSTGWDIVVINEKSSLK